MKAEEKYKFAVSGTFYCAIMRRKISIKELTVETADACFKAGCTWLALVPKATKEKELKSE